MKKTIILIIGIIGLVSYGFSQNEVDALRYSYVIPGGTSRANAMGGSFGALGADASSLFFNPAGMGVYKTSDFTITPGFELINNSASYLGKTSDDFDVKMNLNNFSYVGTIKLGSTGFNSLNLGIGYNRMNNFNENIIIEGVNKANSMSDWFAARANSGGLDEFYSNAAYQTYLINDLPDGTFVSALESLGQNQKQFINRSGYQGEYSIAVSGSIQHKLFLGMALGIQAVRFNEVKTMVESDPNDDIYDFESFEFKEFLNTRGSGVNFKFGVLYNPTNWIRFGASLHTPTFLSLRDHYRTTMSTKFKYNQFEDKNSFYYNSMEGNYNYKLITPLKAQASVGFIIGKSALINIDYEFVDYAKSRLRGNDYTFSDENQNIKDAYKSTHNVKIGGEYRLGQFSLRAGGAYYDSPYVSSHTNSKSYTLVYSGGIGVRFATAYIDLAYSYVDSKDGYYQIYSGYGEGIDSPLAKIDKNQSRVTLTLGFKF